MKVEVPLKIAHRLINHGPVALLSTFYNNRPNVQTLAWLMPIDYGHPKVAFVVGSDNYTYECLIKTGECVINIPNKSLIKEALGCGSTSGKDVDKFKRFKLTTLKGKTTKEAPLVKECVGHLECKLINEPVLAKKYDLFLADVTYAWAEKDLFKDFWLIKNPRAQTIHHLGSNRFATLAKQVIKIDK